MLSWKSLWKIYRRPWVFSQEKHLRSRRLRKEKHHRSQGGQSQKSLKLEMDLNKSGSMYTRNSQSFKESMWYQKLDDLKEVRICDISVESTPGKIKQSWLQGLLLWEQVGLYAFFMPLLCIAAKSRFGHCAFGSWLGYLSRGRTNIIWQRERGGDFNNSLFHQKPLFFSLFAPPLLFLQRRMSGEDGE